MEPVRIENNFRSLWPPPLEFSSRNLVPSAEKKEVNNNPTHNTVAFLSWAVARAHFPLRARCHCCGLFPGEPKSLGSWDGQWTCGHLRCPEPERRRAAGQQVRLGAPISSHLGHLWASKPWKGATKESHSLIFQGIAASYPQLSFILHVLIRTIQPWITNPYGKPAVAFGAFSLIPLAKNGENIRISEGRAGIKKKMRERMGGWWGKHLP